MSRQEGDDGAVDPTIAWVRAAREGDDEATERLCRFLEGPLTSYVRAQMGPEARRWVEPDDIVFGVLHEVLRSLDSLAEDATSDELLGRLKQRAKWRIRDSVRAQRNNTGESSVPRDAASPGRERGTGSVTRADDRRWLKNLITQLPPKYREVVRLCVEEGLTFQDVSHRLQIPVGTVRKRYERARDALMRRHRKGHE